MNRFISSGLYTQGCITPVTTEDPEISVLFDDFSENFRVNIFLGKTCIDSLTIANHKQACNDVLRLPVIDRQDNYLGTIEHLIKEQLRYDYYSKGV